MWYSHVLTVFVAAFATASGQFLQRWGGGNVVSSSFISSSSWSWGRDGQMHKQVQETRNEVVQDGSDMKQTRSKVVCKDGHCQEAVLVSSEPAMQELHTMPMYNRPFAHTVQLPPRLRGMLDRLMGPRPQQQHTEIIVGRVQQPEVIIQQPMNVNPDRYGQPIWGNIKLMPLKQVGEPQLQSPASSPTAPWQIAHWRQLRIITLGAAFFAIVAAYTAVMAIIKCRRSDIREAARERPLHALAEPLAPEEDPMQVLEKSVAPVSSRKVAAVPLYLSRLYARANDTSETRSVRKYLLRFYTRVLG